jgi:hypothetical protein
MLNLGASGGCVVKAKAKLLTAWKDTRSPSCRRQSSVLDEVVDRDSVRVTLWVGFR